MAHYESTMKVPLVDTCWIIVTYDVYSKVDSVICHHHATKYRNFMRKTTMIVCSIKFEIVASLRVFCWFVVGVYIEGFSCNLKPVKIQDDLGYIFSATMNQVNVDSSTGRNGRLGAVSLASFHLHRTMSWAFQALRRGRWFHVWKWLYSNGLHDLPCTQEILRITSMELEELSFGLFLLVWAGCRAQSLYS